MEWNGWNSYNTIRLVSSIIFAWFYLLIINPTFAISLLILAVVLYSVYIAVVALINNDTKNQPQNKKRGFKTKDEITLRNAALQDAKIYLAPYDNIWGTLKLSNKRCRLMQFPDGTIVATETFPYEIRKFKVIDSDVHTLDELWNLFCITFSWQTSYEGLIEQCERLRVKIKENKPKEQEKKISLETDYLPAQTKKLDINNASEMELTALPGVNIIMAKRIIKRREELRGFKSVDAFLDFIKLSPHAESVIKERVCVNKMKGSLKIERNKERKIDL